MTTLSTRCGPNLVPPVRPCTHGWLGLLLAGAMLAPLHATETVPAATLNYRSVFEGYRPYAKENTPDWRNANERVEQIGGWRTYMKESQQAPQENRDASAPAAPLPTNAGPDPVPAPAGHHHHHAPGHQTGKEGSTR